MEPECAEPSKVAVATLGIFILVIITAATLASFKFTRSSARASICWLCRSLLLVGCHALLLGAAKGGGGRHNDLPLIPLGAPESSDENSANVAFFSFDENVAFFLICVLAVLFSIITVNVLYRGCCCCSRKKQNSDLHNKLTTFEGHDTFQDFTVPLPRVLILFFTQFALAVFYIDGMRQKMYQHISYEESGNENERCVYENEYRFYYWAGVAVMFGYSEGTDVWGAFRKSMVFWRTLWTLRGVERSYNSNHTTSSSEESQQIVKWVEQHKMEDFWGKSSVQRDVEIFLRFIFGIIINKGVYFFILFALPFQVAVGSPDSPEVVPLSFVIDVMSALFIIQLDDLSTPQAYQARVNIPESREDSAGHDATFNSIEFSSECSV